MAKRALLIGINKYMIAGADLRGCVNDVKNIKSALTKYYGFASKDITVLLDHAATTEAMKKAITKLVKDANKGDTILLHYSGHGANVPDKNGDEADKRDEILCPADLDWKKPLTDDWLRRTFNKLKAGVNFTVIMDCCHSGNNTRVFRAPDAASIARYLPNPWDLMAVESGRALRGKKRTTLRASSPAKRAKSDAVDAKIDELLITGCRDTQTSADAYIGGSFNGALTYHLVKVIKGAKGKVSYRDLHQQTIRLLKKGNYDQVPQLEGRSAKFTRLFLS
jgi:uncharacterized caspase-like protein